MTDSLFYQQRFKKDVDSCFGKDGEKIMDFTLNVSEKMRNIEIPLYDGNNGM
jgi:hypothetical protein